ncbi:MAG: S53 family peptidase [Solirubrobacteraceae bacterium]
MRASIRLGSFAAAVTTVALMLGAGTALGSSGSTTSPGSTVTVAQGVQPSQLPGATAFGTTDPSTPETVSFVLRERHFGLLSWAVQHGLRAHFSESLFADVFGQSQRHIFELTSYLQRFGIATQVYSDNVDVVATGTAGQFNQALSVQQRQYHVPAQPGSNGMNGTPAQTVHGADGSPRLPWHFARYVLAILGLSNYAPFTSQAVHVKSAVVHPQQGSSDACLALTGLPNACHTATDFADQYNLAGLYKQGATGQGQTLGIVTLAALDVGAPETYWSTVLHQTPSGRTVTVDNIDGGPGAPSDKAGTGETDLDVEQSGGVAPGANVIVYQAPNTDPGFADAFFTAASQDVAGSVSASWGESETYVQAAVASGTETPAYEAAFDEAFLEFAAQGQAGFLSSGDQAAYDATADLGTTNLAVDTSADSPFITSSGGTTLPWSGTLTGSGGSANVTVSNQRTWGWDYLWQAFATTTPETLTAAAESDVVGSGGGFSVFEPEPAYQWGVSGTNSFSAVQYLTPTDYKDVSGITEPTAWDFNPTPSVSHGTGSGRAEPDLAANADPFSGYLLYEPSFAQVGQPVLQGGWGGTSFVAPQLNGSAAVIDSSLGNRTGFWNPTLYSAAQSGNSPLTPLDESDTGSDNIYYTGTPGTVYNPGSGLGYPDLTALASAFPRSFTFGRSSAAAVAAIRH